MIYCFKEKHDDRFVMGDTPEAICKKVLLDRIRDGYWYTGDAAAKAEKAFDSDMCAPFLRSRQGAEYEGFYEIYVEKA